MKYVPDYRRIEVVDAEMVPVLRALSGEKRLEIASGMYRSARILLTAAVRKSHPEWNDQLIQQEVAWRLSHGACGTRPVCGEGS